MILVVLLQAAEMCGVFPLTLHGPDPCACVVPLSPCIALSLLSTLHCVAGSLPVAVYCGLVQVML